MTPVSTDPALVLEATLDSSGSTVTALIEQLTGERIDAEIRSQATVPATGANTLELEADASVLHRAVLLRGRVSGRTFVCAHAIIATDRLPTAARLRLLHSRDPIGRVLVDQAISFRRAPIGGTPEQPEPVAHLFGPQPTPILARRYLIVVGGLPTFDVSEWFLPAVAEALARADERLRARPVVPGPAERSRVHTGPA